MPYGEGSPQLEDGFARIANEILDALARTSLTDYESRCIHYLWRKTYGWQNGKGDSKTEDIIAYSQWAAGTCIDKRAVRRALQSLANRQIITKKTIKRPGKNPLTIWGFQKYYQKWNGYNSIQLELRSPQPPLSEQLGSPEPPVDAQVGAGMSLLRHEVRTNSVKVGSPAPPEVGSPAPPTIDNIDNTTKDLYVNPLEESLLKIISELDGWHFNVKEDLAWLRDFLKDYGGIKVTDFKACRDYFSGKPPPRNKGPWKNRLRNWMAVKGRISKPQKRVGKLPTTEELEIQAKEKGLL